MGAVEIVGLISGILNLAANAGVDYEQVSAEIAKAQADGSTLSAAQLKALAQNWKATDKVEQAAYKKSQS